MGPKKGLLLIAFTSFDVFWMVGAYIMQALCCRITGRAVWNIPKSAFVHGTGYSKVKTSPRKIPSQWKHVFLCVFRGLHQKINKRMQMWTRNEKTHPEIALPWQKCDYFSFWTEIMRHLAEAWRLFDFEQNSCNTLQTNANRNHATPGRNLETFCF